MRSKKPTITDIARLADVSTATVSRVLNGGEGVSQFAKDKVEEAIEQLGYERSPKGSKSWMKVGLIIPNVLNPFFSLLIKGIESVARLRDCSIVLCDSEDSVDMESRNIERLVDIEIDGVIFVASGSKNKSLKMFADSIIPVVLSDRIVEGSHDWTVTADNLEGSYQAVSYLINLGHRRIVHLSGSASLSTERERHEGYTRALDESGVPLHKELVIPGGYHFESATEVMRRTIESGVEFSAIFAANDLMALGAAMALKGAGRRIPQDVSIVGYDDIPFSPLFGLTTVAQPALDIGRESMVMLIDLMEGRLTAPQHLKLRPSMVIRQTCAPYQRGKDGA
jgi:DNA-binding LacI/PurR family transcriptional regulator